MKAIALNNKTITSSSSSPFQSIPSPSSKGPTTSVRLGKRWPEFQGLNDWAGLLHPQLDPTLRSEILRYGQFIQAAYTCFDCNPSSLSYATCRYPKQSLLPNSGLPNTGYKVIRNLHASSGARLPKWANNIGPEWVSKQSSWIGYVAVCQDEEEVARLGRRDIVIAYRGTVTCMEWLENLRATLTHLPSSATSSGSNPEPMVERGFWSLFTSSGLSRRSLRDQVRI